MSLLQRVINLWRTEQVNAEIEAELQSHLEIATEEAERMGIPPEEARRAARLRLGNPLTLRERTAGADTVMALGNIWRDLRHTVRQLKRSPAFTLTAVITLALGIGANSTVFSAINAVLLRPLPFPNGDQLERLEQHKAMTPNNTNVAFVRLMDWNRLNSTFESVTGYYTQDESETSGDLPERLKRALVAPRFLEVLGIAPMLGRDFAPIEETFGGPNTALISERFWRRRFNGDPGVLGKQLRFSGAAYSIIGVMPASFVFPDRDVDLWSPSLMDATRSRDRAQTYFTVIGRLKSSATLEQARADLATVQANLGKQFPATDAELTVNIRPLKEVRIGGVRNSLWILYGSVSLLLLIACANIGALLLARGTMRQQEISIRFSLGATRLTVVRSVLAEALVLALCGAALGLLLAFGAMRELRVMAEYLPRVSEIGLDWRLILYTLGCSVAATLLCGLLPALRTAARDVSAALAHVGRAQVSGRRPLQYALVWIQVALAVTLLMGAGLLLRSFEELGRVSPGFEYDHILTFQISSSWGESNRKILNQRGERILNWLAATPGVESAGMSILALPGVPQAYQVEMQLAEGRADSEPKMIAESRGVSPSYFATMRIPLLSGEICRVGTDTPNVVVNRAFVNAYLNRPPVGLHLIIPGALEPEPAEIRGVVGDAREIGLNHEPVPTVYNCYEFAQAGAYYLIRTRTKPTTVAETVRRRIHDIEPARSVFAVMPLAQHFDDAFAENRLRTVLLLLFALTAMSLAAVGLYGTLNYVVNARRREVGLRLALGANRGQILGRFLLEGISVAAGGCITGIGLASAFEKVLSGMLYAVTPTDPETLAIVIAFVMAVATLASFLPSSRAARVEPMQVLRNE